MDPEIVPPTVEAIRRWSGVEPPNAAALHGLADMAQLIADIEAVRARPRLRGRAERLRGGAARPEGARADGRAAPTPRRRRSPTCP